MHWGEQTYRLMGGIYEKGLYQTEEYETETENRNVI
jgi:hypothetical protein